LTKRRPVWRGWLFLAGLALIPVLMVTVDGPISAAMRDFDGNAKAIVDVLAESGDSKHSLVPLAIAVGALMLLYFLDTAAVRARIFAWLAGACGFVFVSIAYSGILINLMKIAIGRTRPHVVETLSWPEFHPFTVTANFHSFPSGHANTVFAIALAVGFLVPALRRYLLVLAAGLAFCRVLQFRHFVSDSLAGAMLAVATTFWLRDVFARRSIVFHVGKDGRISLTAPGRLLRRQIKRGFGVGARPRRLVRDSEGRAPAAEGGATRAAQ
jgi:membrane-associated phospholipid phosphatase